MIHGYYAYADIRCVKLKSSEPDGFHCFTRADYAYVCHKPSFQHPSAAFRCTHKKHLCHVNHPSCYYGICILSLAAMPTCMGESNSSSVTENNGGTLIRKDSTIGAVPTCFQNRSETMLCTELNSNLVSFDG